MDEALRGAFAKLEWSQEHLALLQGHLTRFAKPDDNTLVDEIDPESGRHVQRARGLPLPPREVGLIFSDVVHNLRAALDYAVFRPNKRGEPQTSFPVFLIGSTRIKNKRSYAKDGIKSIKYLSTPAKEFIDWVQPYHRHQGRRHSPLWLLHELARAEKHHRIPLITRRGQREYSEIFTSGGKDIPEEVDSGGLYFDEGDVAAVLWSPLHPEISLKPHLVLKVFVGEGGPASGYEVGPLAASLYSHVTWILTVLQRSL